MMAMVSTTQTALFAECGTKPMPFFLSMPTLCMGMAAAASTILFGTGVFTSVSLFLVVFLVITLLLVSLVVILSLILSGLTGLMKLASLVGLTVGLIANESKTTQGD